MVNFYFYFDELMENIIVKDKHNLIDNHNQVLPYGEALQVKYTSSGDWNGLISNYCENDNLCVLLDYNLGNSHLFFRLGELESVRYSMQNPLSQYVYFNDYSVHVPFYFEFSEVLGLLNIILNRCLDLCDFDYNIKLLDKDITDSDICVNIQIRNKFYVLLNDTNINYNLNQLILTFNSPTDFKEISRELNNNILNLKYYLYKNVNLNIKIDKYKYLLLASCNNNFICNSNLERITGVIDERNRNIETLYGLSNLLIITRVNDNKIVYIGIVNTDILDVSFISKSDNLLFYNDNMIYDYYLYNIEQNFIVENDFNTLIYNNRDVVLDKSNVFSYMNSVECGILINVKSNYWYSFGLNIFFINVDFYYRINFYDSNLKLLGFTYSDGLYNINNRLNSLLFRTPNECTYIGIDVYIKSNQNYKINFNAPFALRNLQLKLGLPVEYQSPDLYNLCEHFYIDSLNSFLDLNIIMGRPVIDNIPKPAYESKTSLMYDGEIVSNFHWESINIDIPCRVKADDYLQAIKLFNDIKVFLFNHLHLEKIVKHELYFSYDLNNIYYVFLDDLVNANINDNGLIEFTLKFKASDSISYNYHLITDGEVNNISSSNLNKIDFNKILVPVLVFKLSMAADDTNIDLTIVESVSGQQVIISGYDVSLEFNGIASNQIVCKLDCINKSVHLSYEDKIINITDKLELFIGDFKLKYNYKFNIDLLKPVYGYIY